MPTTDFRQAPIVLLDNSRPAHRAGRSLLFRSPEFIIRAETLADVPSALEAIDSAVARGLHVAGWIAYECAGVFEPRIHGRMAAKADKADEPLIWMMATKHRETFRPGDLSDCFHAARRGSFRQARLEFGESPVSEEAYLAALDTVHSYIQAGDVYQINHTFPLPIRLTGDSLALYEQLRASQPVPYGAYIDTGAEDGFKVLSLSPELFVSRNGGQLTGKPMKGTAPRGLTFAEDQEIARTLAEDLKSRAENLMIVDLIRNDLSRISAPGSVSVTKLFETETYPTLFQMTSTIEAMAHEGLVPSQLLQALFPCGSVTGAPKIRAMEIIDELEPSPRGVYCGTIGHFSPAANGQVDWSLNVPIRTMVLDKSGMGRLSVGSGVVADSSPAGEYDECLLKARFAQGESNVPFSLIETMRLNTDGSIELYDEHLARLEASAAYFDFAFDLQDVELALEEHRLALASSGSRRVRLLLSQSGAVTITSAGLPQEASTETAKICLGRQRTDSGDPFLRHKTTRREIYDGAFARALKAGFNDILFFNERDELTEGAISNVFVVKDGVWTTPSLSSGVLPGTLRARMLAQTRPRVEETVISRAALMEADEIYIGNSVRGLRRAILSETTL